MSSQIEHIIEAIERLRSELNAMERKDKMISNLKLLEKSRELDKVIYQYYEFMQNEKV